eukprot:GHVQ01008574.1.p1 GENE.GHVQ01008574.1~~GHVQ01008574.1.p1  ORF type:complete len:360 (-),score=39.22 GHVQ01008574.1:107-1186(-)
MYVLKHTHTYTYMYTHAPTHTVTHKYNHISTCPQQLHTLIRRHTNKHTHTYTHIYTHTHTHAHTNAHIHTHTHTNAHIQPYFYVSTRTTICGHYRCYNYYFIIITYKLYTMEQHTTDIEEAMRQVCIPEDISQLFLEVLRKRKLTTLKFIANFNDEALTSLADEVLRIKATNPSDQQQIQLVDIRIFLDTLKYHCRCQLDTEVDIQRTGCCAQAKRLVKEGGTQLDLDSLLRKVKNRLGTEPKKDTIPPLTEIQKLLKGGVATYLEFKKLNCSEYDMKAHSQWEREKGTGKTVEIEVFMGRSITSLDRWCAAYSRWCVALLMADQQVPAHTPVHSSKVSFFALQRSRLLRSRTGYLSCR